MASAALTAKLKDADYLRLHLTAAAVLRGLDGLNWYDAVFLRRFEAARRYLALVRPDAAERFERAFDVFTPPADFAPILLNDLFDAATRSAIRQEIEILQPADLEGREMASFGRHILHDLPAFTALQDRLTRMVGDHVGMALEPGYNFLSLYGESGRCAPHLDQPVSMFTLDYCVDQSGAWPIHFSQPAPWPRPGDTRWADPAAIAREPSLRFTPCTLEPGDAVIFCGSSQWHYRDPMPRGDENRTFCHLLFFHYRPAGSGPLTDPACWADHFDLPELAALIDLFGAAEPDPQ